MILDIAVIIINILVVIAIFTTKRQVGEVKDAVDRLVGMIGQLQAPQRAAGTGPVVGSPSGSTASAAAFDSSPFMGMEVCERCGAFKQKNWFCYVCKGPKKSGRPIDADLLHQLSMEASRDGLTAEQLIQSRTVCIHCGVVKRLEKACPGCGRT